MTTSVRQAAAASSNHPASSTRRRRIRLAALALMCAATAGYWYASAQTPGRPGARGPARSVPVVAANARKGDVAVTIAGLGTVTPLATVTVRSRIDGQLMNVHFREGQLVKKDELLAEIDPRPYQVQLAQAEGQMARDAALLQNARIDLERYRVLLQQDSIARQQLDTQQALVRQYEGTVKVDQAQIDSARLQLAYCRIRAPVGGRLGLRQIDPGNMVHASDANGLVVITQLEPIAVVFSIPEDSLPQVVKKLRAGDRLAVDAYDRADKEKLASGTLLTVDNQIDPATGSVKLKAQFANRDAALFPNQFVNARMLLEVRHGAVLVPGAAIQRGTPGTFVYVVGSDGSASVRVVKLGPAAGDEVSILAGLAAGERVVVDGADKLREGAKVEAIDKEAKPAAAGARTGKPDAGAALSPEERRKRWAELDARIDRGEFGEEIKKLPEAERMQRMRELARRREAATAGSQTAR